MRILRPSLATAALAVVVTTAAGALAADPVQLRIASFSQQSSWYAYGVGLAELLRDKLPEGSTIDTPPEGGGTKNPPLVAAGQFNLAFGMAVVSGWAEKGEVAYDKPMPMLRGLVGGLDQYYLAVVAKPAGAGPTLDGYLDETKKDITVILRQKGSIGGFGGKQLLALAGASEEDIDAAGGRYEEAKSFGVVKNALTAGEADLWIHTVTAGHPAMTEISETNDLAFLQPSDTVLKEMTAKYSWGTATMPAGIFRGQDVEVTFPGTTTALFTSADLPEDVAYTIVKTICENENAFKAVHKALSKFSCAEKAWKPENVVLPLHPGAAKYYKEKGWM